MNVLKKINHNTVLVEDGGIEKVAMGKGIGFSAIVNETLDATMVDKFFVLDSKEKTRTFSELVRQIPIEYIEFSEEMIEVITEKIDVPLDSTIYITLTDHIYFAIKRKKEERQVSAIMLPEMKLLYPEEYQVATEIVEEMNQRYRTDLGINEVGFITMHIINAELSEKNSLNSLKILEMTTAILQFLETQGIIKNKESLAYQRLMLHVKFLVKRLIYQEMPPVDKLSFFSDAFKQTVSYQTATKTKRMIEETYHFLVQENEVIYLAIHLARAN
ncbi:MULTISPECIES: PRD domain-containing protein [unclassified Enterococcus]|uniref:PRD domain-containing protein n=1 Tax=unclassified Enterococcus TaxID=2608891 RepID=UPI0013ECCFF4